MSLRSVHAAPAAARHRRRRGRWPCCSRRRRRCFALTRPRRRLQPGRRVPRRADRDRRARAEPRGRPRRARSGDPLRDFIWPLYGYSQGPPRATCRPRSSLRPPFWRVWSYTGARPARVPAGDRRAASCSCSRTTARCTRSTSAPASVLLAAQARHARRRLARLRRRPRLRDDPRARQGARPGASPRCDAKDGKILVVAAAAEPHASPRRCSTTTASTSAPRTAPSTRCAPSDGSVRWTFKAARRGQGRRSRSPTASSTSATTAAASTRSAQADGRQVWQHGHRAAARFGLRAGQLLLDARGRLRARLHRQHRRQRVLVLRRQRQARLARRAPAATSTPRPPSRRCRGGKPTVYFGSYDGTLLRARRAHRQASRWTHRDGGKISGGATVVGDIVYFSNLGKKDTTGPRRAHRPQGLPHRPRRVQPGRLRRAHDLPDRLLVAVRAQAAARRGSTLGRIGTPAAARRP